MCAARPCADQQGLDVHHDSCDVTFNAALDEPESYTGSGLRFCGLYSTREYREYAFTYRHVLGRAILYDGRIRHGAEPIESGARTNLVMWLHSSRYRDTRNYELGQTGVHALGPGTADSRCVSHHHDEDYCLFRLRGHEAFCSASGRNHYMRTWRRALQDGRYWQIGTTYKDWAVSSSAAASASEAGQQQCAA